MKIIKKSIIIISLVMSVLTCGWSAEDAQKTVTDLVTQIQSIVKAGGSQDQYKPILLQHLDFDEISRRVLDGVRKEIKNAKDAKTAQKEINDFLPTFIPIFTDYMIKKYSKPDITEKFKNMTFKIGNSGENGKYILINSTLKSEADSLGDIKIEWKTLSSKVVDMVFSDASASLFRNEASEATAKYKTAGSLDGLLKQYK
jgi:hypothetical protein